MQYVYVAGGGSDDAMDRAITQQTQFALYSLIGGLRQKDFGLHTIEEVTCSIRDFSKRFVNPVGGKIVTDSGGYSFIKGDIPPEKLPMLIDCYNVYLESEISEYNYIFSLDIPFSLKYEGFNTAKNVLEANYKSIEESKRVLERNKSLREKFYYVWHFKIEKQFIIWKTIYKHFKMSKFAKNHAIGGLVGLKEAAKVKFAPFVGMSYFILDAKLQESVVDESFRMHYLGVYTKTDRFCISFLEKLFCRYVLNVSTIQMSYDSINPIHTARMNAAVPLYSLIGEEFKIYPSLLKAPEDVLRSVSCDDAHFQVIMSEIDRRNEGLRLENSASFSPLNVYSNLELDKFFALIIERYDLTGEFAAASSPTNLNGRLTRIFADIEKRYPNAFSPYMNYTITLTLERAWYWHKWFVGKRDAATLDTYMAQEIKEIAFPAQLR